MRMDIAQYKCPAIYEGFKRRKIQSWSSFDRKKLRCYGSRESVSHKEEVYYATFPFVGMESLEGALVFSGRELPQVMAQHCAIIVERPSEGVMLSSILSQKL